jgi:N-acetylmuramoyl-L-alanine amidase
MTDVKQWLDAGHGEENGHGDPGAVNEKEGLMESKINLDLSKRIEKYLLANFTGIQIKQTRTDGTFVSLAARADRANAWGADAFLSIHVNAGGGTGYESFIYSGPVSNRTKDLQKAINKYAVEAAKKHGLGTHGNNPFKRDNLSVVRRTHAPAVLTEICYIDSKDSALLKKDSFLQDMAEAYAKGLAEFHGLKRKASETVQNSSGKTKVVVVTYDGKEGLNFRTKPDFRSKVGYVAKKDEAFTIVEELDKFYKIKSGLYVTKAKEYVTTKFI